MKSIFILKHNLMRATMTLAIMMACAMAWAQSTNFTYDDGYNTYTIHNADGWDEFCDMLANNDKGIFTGKTVKLDTDIGTAQDPITRMAGSSQHDFTGTFDGNGKTLTVSYGTAESPISEDKVAPFRNVESGCIIENLHVAGDIYTKGKNAAGIAGTQYGAVTIRNCRVSTTIHSYTGGDGTHGGLVGYNGNGANSALTIEGCVFDGNLLTEGPTATIKCGGFVGWHSSERTVNISNSLYAPATLGTGKAEPTNNSATFCRNGITTLTNCYYTRTLGDEQGLLMRSITEGDNVTIEAFSPVGEATATYNVSGITAYTKGITRTVDETTTFYYGEGDYVSLTLSNTAGEAPLGYQYSYTASAGTLTDNDNLYTLTMPNEDVTISIALTGMAVSVSYINENGETKTINAVALDGTESELYGSAYYVGTDINYTNHIKFNNEEGTILILGDGATMTVDNTDDAIYTRGNLTIYGQALGTGKLNANTNSSCIYTSYGTSITINGGTVTATGGSSAIRAYYEVTINGGTVTATGGSCAVWADYDVTINGGTVTATGGSSAIQSTYSSVTINGGTVTATGNENGIVASETITLGWKNASDHIYANSYITSSSYVSVKDSQKLTDEDGNTYSGNVACSTIASKTLYPEIVIFYLDENGQRRLCTNYTTLTSNTTSLGTAGQETWYVVDGSINFTSTISTAGDVHLILKDNAVMNVGTEGSPIQDNYGIRVDGVDGDSLSIYGQSTGESKGQLKVYSTNFGIGAISGTVTINGGQVTVHGNTNGIYAFNSAVNINGGQVTVHGNNNGIYALNSNITLSWTNPTDYIYANSYFTNGTLSLTKTFIDEDGTTHTPNNIGTIDGKTLYPEGVIFYLDENGQRQLCTNYTTLTSNTTSLGTAGLETWYVAEGTLNYSQTISLNGDVHLILKDNAVMNVGTEGTSINGRGDGIVVGGHTLIYAQSTGAVKGQLNVNHYTTGIKVYKDLTINGGQVTVDVSGEGGITLNGIWSDGSVTINGGQVTTNGNHGIRATNTTNNTVATVITINGGQVTVIASGEEASGISADSSLIINGGHVTVDANGSNNIGIGSDGSVTINGGSIHVSSNQYGIKFRNSLTINGGQVSVHGNTNGIYALNSNVTLSWTNPTDYIYANSYYAGLTLSLTKTFKDEDGNLHTPSNIGTINGKTLYPESVIMRKIDGYNPNNSGPDDYTKWVFIASPVVGSLAPSEVHNLFPSAGATSTEYDLYRFDQRAEREWQNYKVHYDDSENPFNALVNGQGYLYATKATRTLVFAGTPYNGDGMVPLVYEAGAQFAGWNLVGNPFADTVCVKDGQGLSKPYFKMNAARNELIADSLNSSVGPMEGIFVYTTTANDTVVFTSQRSRAVNDDEGSIVIDLSGPSVPEPRSLSQSNGVEGHEGTGVSTGSTTATVIDRAIVRFDEGQTLPKFQINENSTKIYIPQDGKDYAVASADRDAARYVSTGVNEMPLNFKAKENGTYTIAVNVDNVEMGYLHLIDNMTGADIDLLAANGGNARHGDARHGDAINRVSTYTFSAKTTDYESRFKLVFSVGVPADGDNEAFAFIDASGNIVITGVGDACNASLQMVDVTGRVIACRDAVPASLSLSTAGMAPGVYVLRLINGENVRTQKIVVE